MLPTSTRIRLLAMDDGDPIPVGATGTITSATRVEANGGFIQYEIAWDQPHEHRALMVCVPPDEIVQIEKGD